MKHIWRVKIFWRDNAGCYSRYEYFTTREKAREFKRWHKSNPDSSHYYLKIEKVEVDAYDNLEV